MKTIHSWLKGKKEHWLILLLGGVLLMILAMPNEENSLLDTSESDATADTSDTWDESFYTEQLENRLENALSKIEGVGKVSVMITLSSSSEKIIEKELETRSSITSGSNSENSQTEDSSEQVVYSGTSGEEVPYVKQEISPTVEGVLVIAEGADQAVVIKNITEVVQALFSVDTHKIRVMKHN